MSDEGGLVGVAMEKHVSHGYLLPDNEMTDHNDLHLLDDNNGLVVLLRGGPVVLERVGLVGLDPGGDFLADFLDL